VAARVLQNEGRGAAGGGAFLYAVFSRACLFVCAKKLGEAAFIAPPFS